MSKAKEIEQQTMSHVQEEDIAFSLDLVERAGQLALSMRESVEIHEKTSPNDPVTSADLELSRLLVSGIKSRYKDDAIVSEEDAERLEVSGWGRVWLIDPIDGTRGYIKNDGQYSVMIGLLVDGRPVFGFINVPVERATYFGGPGYGAWRLALGERKRLPVLPRLTFENRARVIMGTRDRKSHPWVEELPQVELIKRGGIGVKVAKILENQADILVHLSGQLKIWDTAGPCAIALGNEMDAGTMESNELKFELPQLIHNTSVIIGRNGAIEWCRQFIEKPLRSRDQSQSGDQSKAGDQFQSI